MDLPEVPGVQVLGRVLGGSPDTPDALRPIDTDTREFTDEFRVVTGFRGDLPFLQDWIYDTSFLFTQRKNQARDTDTRQQQLGLAVSGFGGPQCDPLTGSPGSDNFDPEIGDCFYCNTFGSSQVQPDGSVQDDPLLANPTELLEWMVGEIRSITEPTPR